MNKIWPFIKQFLFFLGLGAIAVYFASQPTYQYFPDHQALIKMSFKHSAKRLQECRKRTREELQKLPAHERKALECERGRHPLVVEVVLDGETIFYEKLPPSGLFSDGPAKVFASFPVAAGRHEVMVRMRDSGRGEGFDYSLDKNMTLEPLEVLVIDFSPEAGGLVFK
jgi:hypothetical protein